MVDLLVTVENTKRGDALMNVATQKSISSVTFSILPMVNISALSFGEQFSPFQLHRDTSLCRLSVVISSRVRRFLSGLY